MLTREIRKQHSEQDDSVNFIFKDAARGFFEARYVRRVPEYFACYLSSQSGCNQACQMCHLTATGQTTTVDADKNNFTEQAGMVLHHYSKQPAAKIVHYNLMARGEALRNKHLVKEDAHILRALADLARGYGLHPRFNISTIMPKSFKGDLLDAFPVIYPDIYYSIYTTEQDFRDKWLPAAQPVEEAMEKLLEWQRVTKKIIKLHWAFINGENDSKNDVYGITDLVKRLRLRVDINIVRYNPHSSKYGTESLEETIQRNVKILKEELPYSTIQIIPRVGFDVSASCGCFFDE